MMIISFTKFTSPVLAAEEDEAEHGDNHKDNPAAEEDEAEHGDNHNLSHAVALKISSILLVGLLFA